MTELVLGIDSSTTACKAIVFDGAGRILAEGRRGIELHNPAPDAYEQDAEEWWLALQTAVREALSTLTPPLVRSIRALAIAHQRETFVLTDGDSQPLHPALVWMDARCRPEVTRACAELGASHLHQLTGKPACVTPSFYKAMFLLGRQAPELLKQTPRLLDVHAFLAWRLTGECATSLASADPLGLIDMRARSWSEELVRTLGLDPRLMPRLFEPGQCIGTLLPEVAASLGLEPSLRVIAGAGDGQAAGLGAGISDGERAYLNLGTALVSGVLSRQYRCERAFRTLFGAAPGSYFLETDLKGGTFTISWLLEKWLHRDGVNDAELLKELETQAAALPPGSDGLMLVPYWNGVMNPYWDDDATGVVIGFRGDHAKAHLYRAILEGLAFEQRLHSEAVEQSLGTRIREFVIMGGAVKSALFCQILADVLNRKLLQSGTPEATALGAAMLAAVGAGLHVDTTQAARAMATTGESFEPGAHVGMYEALYDSVYKNLYPTLQPSLLKLAELRKTFGGAS